MPIQFQVHASVREKQGPAFSLVDQADRGQALRVGLDLRTIPFNASSKIGDLLASTKTTRTTLRAGLPFSGRSLSRGKTRLLTWAMI